MSKGSLESPKTIVVGMSGGVDSSVCAALLKEQGHHVIGLFMKNWDEVDENGVCPAAKDFEDVARVCDRLDIPYYSVEFIKEYQENVFSHFLREYERGHTPNPDILCNREIKFKVFFDKAMELGADYLATGHYCQNPLVNGERILAKGADPGKDQSYFLYTIKSSILEKVVFPVGGLQKSEVREIAHRYDLSTKDKKDSTGICFIGERNFRDFLSKFIQLKDGNFENLKGEVVGRHHGAAYYTIGQRKGLGLGGQGEPWFVVGKDMDRNVVLVERGERHPALYCDELYAEEVSWVSDKFPGALPFRCKAKVRYRQKDQDCTIVENSDGRLKVVFDHPQRGVAPRQSIVFYAEDNCLGGAIIDRAGPSYFEMQKDLPLETSE